MRHDATVGVAGRARRAAAAFSFLGASLVAVLAFGCGGSTGAAGAPRSGSAASCAALSPAAQFAHARVVFVGTMLAGPSVRVGGRDVLSSPARVRVARYLKGSGSLIARVVTGVTGGGNQGSVAEDGIEPVAGERWEIYSDSRREPYDTSICAGSRSLQRVWRAPLTLVPSSQYTSGLQLAVSADGHVAAGWLQGPPPKVTAGPAAGQVHATPTTRQQVTVDLGTLSGGFGKPLVLRSGSSGTLGAPSVAQSGAHLSYAVWGESPNANLRIAVLRDGQPQRPPVIRLHDAQPVALAAVHGGRAALVWEQYGQGFPFLEYALVGANGGLGRTVTIAHLSGQDSADPKVSLNNRGELVAAWVHGGGIRFRRPGHPLPYGKARLIVTVCKPAGQCTAPRAIRLETSRPACLNPAVAISDGGIATLLAAGQDPGPHGCTTPLGVWSATSGTGRDLGPTSVIAAAGDAPVATPLGRGGALTVFNPGTIPYQTLAWSVLTPQRRRFTKPLLIPDPSTINTPSLAANTDGQFVIAWAHASARRNPKLSIKAALGEHANLDTPQLIVSTSTQPGTFTTAIDAHGNAIVLWNEFRQNTTTSGFFGISAAIHRG